MTSPPRGTLGIVLTMLAGAVVGSPCAVAQQSIRDGFPAPIEVRAGSPPRAVPQGAGVTIAYELLLANPFGQAITVERLHVEGDDGAPFFLTKGGELAPLAVRLPALREGEKKDGEHGLVIEPGERYLLYLWFSRPVGAGLSERLHHRFDLRGGGYGKRGGEAPIHWTLDFTATIEKDFLVIDPPVRGGRWWVSNGFANDTDHRRSFVASGELLIPQRFGADFMKLDAMGDNASGDVSRNSGFHSFGEPLYAVAAGEVVSVRNDLENRGPGESGGTFEWDELPGNHVLLKIHERAYALYAHLQKGSIRVVPRQRVERGAILGAIGNSGHTQVPHLHFHVSDRPQANLANGVPFVFRSYEVLLENYFFRAEERPLPTEGTPFEGSIPEKHSVVRFPE